MIFQDIFNLFIATCPIWSVYLATSKDPTVIKETYKIRPLWQPPAFVFGIVWPIIFLLLTVENFRLIYEQKQKQNSVNIIILIILEAICLGFYQFFMQDYEHIYRFELGLIMISLLIVLLLVRVREFPTSMFYAPYCAWIYFAWILQLQLCLNLTK